MEKQWKFKDKDQDEKQYNIGWMTNKLGISSHFLMTIPASYCDNAITATLPF